jgi:hypothetical protein
MRVNALQPARTVLRCDPPLAEHAYVVRGVSVVHVVEPV